MCTLVILRRPHHHWPLLLAANRDELVARPARPPGRHWPDRPEVIAGYDEIGGGSWLGINDHGLVAAVLNRTGSLGPAASRRSRGELVLEALDHAEASSAAGALADLYPAAYRPFNLVVADPRAAYWLRHGDDGEVRVHPIAEGLHLLADSELDDPQHTRIRRFLPLFRQAPVPDPEQNAWDAWIALLQQRGDATGPGMNLELSLPEGRFASVASSLIAVPAYPGFAQPPSWLHAQGAPDRVPFAPVDLTRRP
ncbi:MAG: hypothetical protein EA400_05260 [Chromatiaceae bacterium]|nr:MAG: hypothetical protein EA400_05260 [Chromatiaceae bacterium]